MSITIYLILAFVALCLTVASAITGKMPLWAAVFVLALIALIQALAVR